MNSDRIEKKIVLRSTRERVWRAVSDSAQFGAWFGVEFEAPFVAGSWMTGKIVPTKADPEVAKLQEPYAGATFQICVEQLEPMKRFSFRWHPFAIDSGYDYSSEPMTLVTFDLAGTDGAVLLTISESGFEHLPIARRAKALEANESGWTHQARLVEKYLAHQEQP
ncbi:MAG TPA: SRPBCC family protein [Rhizomicrobium sp.]